MTIQFMPALLRQRPNSRIGSVKWKSRLVQTHGDRWEWIPAREAEKRWFQSQIETAPPISRAPEMQQDVFGIWSVQ